MFTVCLRLSSTSNNPELWGFEEGASNCRLIYGSLVTGGMRNDSKQKGYGISKFSKKISEGYISVIYTATTEDIEAARNAVKGSTSKLSSEAFSIYSAAMELWKKTPIQGLNSLVSSANKPTASTAAIPNPGKATSSKPAKTKSFVVKTEGNSAWAW